ncbi:Type I restriction-modification system, DNA-methyltransferase subunit M [Leucobacter sp. 7(1)]|uniref:type I restriction-modification system subunit M n=1 Tax=Leucobacter sp. 7(1) TaxID=1255613 RepID=UPI00097EA9FF|nr:type I restriction-modification system subunit M [Leucobacter sp. 7(1)]SJN10590.1 Type I restriction-modification system, DNA-methyltransferase subunit M [Leucobacter sp. 7(1)]
MTVALKKSDLYSSLWAGANELRGGMDASQYKDYVLTLLFMKFVTDKAKSDPDSLIEVPEGGSFDDMVAAKGDKEIGDKFNKIIGKLADANDLRNVIDQADFNDAEKLGNGKEMQDRLSKLVTIFNGLDFGGARAEGDDLLGDAYEFLMRHFATESGKSKGQFYTPAEVSRVLAKVVGINGNTRQDETVYDATCGSGSLLLKAADEAPNGMTIYGQEKDNATWALARMNMILHGNETAEIYKGDTITSPQLTRGTELQKFDYVVLNPPFSVKSWTNGLEEHYGRFEYGMPPEKNGDYAFLLHALTSLKSKGKAAIILPHGVLFRGNAEANIRKELLKQGFIRGIIGLPANLFYGTGIPACIVVLDKENAVGRTGVFMVDASKGFVKDGNKNRLRDQDIHKIVDAFNNQRPIERYSRMVPMSEIADSKNDYNLNIPRYIDSSEPEDLQDLDAHINGGIPDRDLDALEEYWEPFPGLREQLFTPNRSGYSDLAVDVNDVQQAIFDAPGFTALQNDVKRIVNEWFESHRGTLEGISGSTRSAELIHELSEDFLARFEDLPLLNEYDAYQQLMSYWHEVMSDDVFLVMQAGWLEASKPRLALNDKERKLAEEPDLVIGTGKNAQKYKMDLILPELIVQRYFADEQAELDALAADLELATAALTEHAEEYGVEEAPLVDATNDKGAYTKQLVSAVVREARGSGDREALALAQEVLELLSSEAGLKKAVKDAQTKLDGGVLRKYGYLSEGDVRALGLEVKWLASISSRLVGEARFLTLNLASRLKTLGDRYGTTVSELDAAIDAVESRIADHLVAMGVG